MSIESEILRIQHNVANAYAAVSEKGGEVPLQPTSANLAAAVESIPSGGSGGEIYSTEEQRIGTWIDGKPLYRKVVFGMTASINVWGGLYSPGNIDTLVFIQGSIDDGTDISFQQFPQAYVATKVKEHNIWIYVTEATNLANRSFVCTIEYTKTTDTATNSIYDRSDATIKLTNSALDLSSIQAVPVTAAGAGVEIAKMEEV